MKPEMIKPYKRSMAVAYAPGDYATRELIRARPGIVQAVYAHPMCDARAEAEALCRARRIPFHVGGRYFSLINQRENTYILAVFAKYAARLSDDRPHIVLACVDDEGNLGAMLRTALACGVGNVAVIEPAADAFHPRAIRASRGALFHLNVQTFDTFEAYRRAYPAHALYPFMLGAGRSPDAAACLDPRFSLIFGNESTGLPASFAHVGEVITIPQTAHVDSMNVAVAMGIGTFIFARKNGLV